MSKSKKPDLQKEGVKSCAALFRPTIVVCLLSAVTAVILAALFFLYQERIQIDGKWNRAIQGLMATVVILPFLLFFQLWRQWKVQYLLDNLRTNLSRLSESDSIGQDLSELSVFPAESKTPAVSQGWNRLLDFLDRLQEQIEVTYAESNVGHIVDSYDAQRLVGLFDALPIGILMADASGRISMANRSCEGKMSRPLSQLIGSNLKDLFDDLDAQSHLGHFLKKQASCSDDYFEVSVQAVLVKTKNARATISDEDVNSSEQPVDTAEPAEISILRVSCHRTSTQGREADIVVTIRDITQQKISEASRDDFIAHVSHELRSPLANIRAYAETLLSDMLLDASSQKEAFNVINDETIRLTRLVNDVLDLSRMESGSMTLEKGEVVMERLIRQSINDLKAIAASKSITLQTNYHPKFPNLYADRDKLAIVINNVLSNAVKYTPEGGTVFLETDVDERFVYIKITDTGYGIAKENIEKIFEKFYRVQNEETAHITGTGLGLATSKEVVTLHGGSIDVTSELNKGTEMIIKLPMTVTGPVLGPAQSA
jgi:signal transduction histidine kinase